MTDEELSKFAVEVHANAIAKGWWAGERDRDELILLSMSELIEAFEVYRDPERQLTDIWFLDDGKPEGFAVEMGDTVIRLLDLTLGWRLYTPDALALDIASWRRNNAFAVAGGSLARALLEINREIDRGGFVSAIALVYLLAERYEVDLDAAMRLKHAYNLTRPARHGGKRA